MRMRKALSCLLALMLSMTVLAVPAMAFSDENAEEPQTSQPLTPEGNMALVDDIDGAASEDKQFIVVQSRGGSYFYIIIDHASEGENIVHFLNQVDEADLLSLIGEEESATAVCTCTDKCKAGEVDTSCPVCAVNMSECMGTEPEPEEPEEPDTPPDEPDTPEGPEKKSGNPLMIVALLAVLAGGGAVAYLKFFKKKPSVKGNTDLDDYDYGDDDDEPEDEDDFDDHEPEDDE